MKTPWGSKDKPKYHKQEARTAKKPGARPQINSGRTWGSLRDVKQHTAVGTILFDNKTTEGRSFRIEKDEWKALKRDSNRTQPGCLPALQVDLGEVHLVVIEEELWDDIIDFMNGSAA